MSKTAFLRTPKAPKSGRNYSPGQGLRPRKSSSAMTAKLTQKECRTAGYSFTTPAITGGAAKACRPICATVSPAGRTAKYSTIFFLPHDKKYGEHCHPNCDCGRFLEIGNSVFMTYRKTGGKFEQLPKPN